MDLGALAWGMTGGALVGAAVVGVIAGGASTFFTTVAWSLGVAAITPVVVLTIAVIVALFLARGE